MHAFSFILLVLSLTILHQKSESKIVKSEAVMIESDKKRENILNGAIRRFCHFGINKTTMSEIADDLSVTKPALYYYFPDKQSIIIAVADKIINEYLIQFAEAVNTSANAEEAIFSLIDLRRLYSEKYYMVHISEDHTEAYLKDPALVRLLQHSKKSEVELIGKSLESGVTQGEFSKMNISRMAELLIDTLHGLAVAMKIESSPFPDQDSFEVLIKKQKEVASIFLNGLKDKAHGRADIK
jgi:AcrR family transcriptional regulator